jgi:phosphatidate cytidylyltransferase
VDEESGTQSDDKRTPDGTEGVRIIGAEEAAEALERGDVAQRRPDDVPRYGDRPAPPPEDGPRPALRFPLGGSTDPTAVGRSPVVPPAPPAPSPTPTPAPPPRPASDTSMPHWTEPATGEVPRILGGDEPDDLDAWSSLTSSAPRWRGEGSDYEAHDFDDVADLGDEGTRVGALDTSDRPHPNDFFKFDELDPEPEPAFEPRFEPGTRSITSDPRRSAGAPGRRAGASTRSTAGAGRDVPMAIVVGGGLGVLALILFSLGAKYAMALVAAVVVFAAAEFFNALRRVGYQPATLLGLAATASMVLSAYWKGEAAYPLVLFLTVAFGLIWYLAGLGNEHITANLGLTTLGVFYVGGLGSFAALLLRLPDGVSILLAAVIATVGYDVGAFAVGRNAGRKPLSAASPNKTWEGMIGGALIAVVVSVVFVGAIPGIGPFDSFGDSLRLGLVAAVAATLGDLCESVLKRDLGVKDMGDILPGHGGLLDRFDAMLFVLPATYYLVRILFT